MAERAPSRTVLRVVSSLHVLVFRMTNGRVGARLGRNEFVLLTTTGRRSGKTRTRPLLLVTTSAGPVLVGSNAGSNRPPGWLVNLVANPLVRIERRSGTHEARARLASADERASLWPEVVERFSQYARYQASTSRTIPLILWDEDTPQ